MGEESYSHGCEYGQMIRLCSACVEQPGNGEM